MQLVQDIYKIIENGEFIKWLIVTIITSLAIALTNTLIYIKLFSVEVKKQKEYCNSYYNRSFFQMYIFYDNSNLRI